MEEETYRDFSLLSQEDILKVMENLKSNRTSTEQTIFIIKSLLMTSYEKGFVLQNIPNVISCSSYEFCQLCPIFDSLIDEDSSLAIPMLKILPSFDYDEDNEDKPRTFSYRLALKIGRIIGENGLNDWIHFLFFCTKKNNVPELYKILKDTLTENQTEQLFKTFENGVRKYLSLFYSVMAKQSKWELFDFYVYFISFSRPSLRTKNNKLFWDSFLSQKFSAKKLMFFFSNHDILSHLFQYISKFIDMVLIQPPKYIALSLIPSFTDVLLTILESFPEFSNSIVEQLLSFALNGQSFISSISVLAMLRVRPEIISKSVKYLDDSISQQGIIEISTLHAISAMIARATSPEMRSMLYISLQKKLLHHSQVIVQTGVSLALHFNRIDSEVSDEIIMWVLRSMKQNALILKPSVLLSVVDIFYEARSEYNLNALCEFAMTLVTNFKLIVGSGASTVTGKNHPKYSISCNTIDSQQQAELCGELIVLVSLILKKARSSNLSKENREIVLTDKNKSVLDLTQLSFVVPRSFSDYMEDNSKYPKLSGQKLRSLIAVREMIISIISRINLAKPYRKDYISLIEAIDNIHSIESENTRKHLLDLSVLWPSYVFNILCNEQFSFPEDFYFVSLMFNSLYFTFVDPLPTLRYFFDDRFEYIGTKVPDTVPLRIITLCSALLEDVEIMKNEVKNIIQIVSNGLDFVTLCVITKSFNVSYDEDVLPLLELTTDVGIACRIILLGYHMKYRKSNLIQIMNSNPQTKFVSDLCKNLVIYPPELPHIEKIVKPFQQGANWRLILYLSLLSPIFDDFYNSFRIIIDQISSKEIASQYSYVLCDTLIARINEWPERFEPIVELSLLTLKVLFNDDIYSLNYISALLNAILQIQEEDETSQFSFDLYEFIRVKINGIKLAGSSKKVSKLFQQISVQLEQINYENPDGSRVEIHLPDQEVEAADEEEDDVFKIDESSNSYTSDSYESDED